MTYKINILKNDEGLNKLLTLYLENKGWSVKCFLTINEVREFIYQTPHLWIIDINILKIDDFKIIKDIKKENPKAPIIFISTDQIEFDRVAALELGCDDYLEYPFSLRELVIRAEKLLERTYNEGLISNTRNVLPLQTYCLDLDRRVVVQNDHIIKLTSKQFDLLLVFAKNQGLALSREQILNNVWGVNYYGNDRSVDDMIRRIRSNLPELRIETIYGFGYRVVK